MTADAAISIRNLSLRHGGLDILRQVGFDVGRNEVVGLIGPNGAGKSALLNCISRVYQPSPDAEVALLGRRDVLRSPAHAIAGHGLSRTFQSLQLSAGLSVRDNIAVGLTSTLRRGVWQSLLRPGAYWRDEARQREQVLRVAVACGVADVLDHRPSALPLGVLRRVDLARALVGSPSVLLLDEPASGLAREERPLIAELIRVARAQHELSVIWVEHDLDLVFSHADRVVVLRSGEVAAIARPGVPAEREALIDAYYH